MTRTKLLVPAGTPDQESGGEMSLPSQVYSAGMFPPGGKAGLTSIMIGASSTTPMIR